IRLGAIPWEDADRVRQEVEVYAPCFRELPPVGPRLPVAIVQLDREDANRAIRLLEDHPPALGLIIAAAGIYLAYRTFGPVILRRLRPARGALLSIAPPSDSEFDPDASAAMYRTLAALTPPAWKRWL